MDIRSLFGGNMRRLRLAAGLSQEAVAIRMGVDRAHVSSMERGQQNITLSTLHLAVEAIGARPADFFAEHREPPPPVGTKPPPTKRLVRPRG